MKRGKKPVSTNVVTEKQKEIDKILEKLWMNLQGASSDAFFSVLYKQYRTRQEKLTTEDFMSLFSQELATKKLDFQNFVSEISEPDESNNLFTLKSIRSNSPKGSVSSLRTSLKLELTDAMNILKIEKELLAKEAVKRREKLKEYETQLKSEMERKLESMAIENEEFKAATSKKLEALQSENNRIKSILYDEAARFGSDSKVQTIPIDIFLSTNNPQSIFAVYEAVLNFIEAIGFTKAFEFDAIRGSWFKKMIGVSKTALTSDELLDRLKKVEYAVEANTILKQQSEIDKNQSEALVNILNAVRDTPHAAIRIGSLLVVKVTSPSGEVNVQCRTLSAVELHLLNRKPELLQSPQQILTALSKAISEENNGETLPQSDLGGGG